MFRLYKMILRSLPQPCALDPAQAMLVAAAMREAGAASMGLVSTHGTGTPLGDPIESGALRKAAAPPQVGPSASGGGGRDNDAFPLSPYPLTLTAVKVLTGHLEGCAGLAGLLQAAACLEHRAAPPLRLRAMNPYVAGEERVVAGHMYCDCYWVVTEGDVGAMCLMRSATRCRNGLLRPKHDIHPKPVPQILRTPQGH